jgi:phage antirepressor YoqD-like protein
MQSQFEFVSGYNQTFSIEEAAKLTNFPGGEHKFYKWLRDKKFILKNNIPSQKMRNEGYIKVFSNLDDLEEYSYVIYGPRVTIKGLAYFSKLVADEFPLCLSCV